MRNRSETMEQHRRKLDDQNQREEEHEHQTDWFELEILFCDVNLGEISGLVGGSWKDFNINHDLSQ
jgi:hypothetical protein